VRKIRGLIEFINPQAFETGYRAASNHERAERSGFLLRTYYYQMEFRETGECRTARSDPGILVHRAVGIL
jgi:hypothetical protein